MARLVSPSAKAIVSLNETKGFIEPNWSDATDPILDSLQLLINGVCDAMETFLNAPMIQQSYSEDLDGTQMEYIFLTHRPVISVTSASENGNPLTAGVDYRAYANLNAVRRIASGSYNAASWAPGAANINVVYTAGLGTQTGTGDALTSNVPERFKAAAMIWAKALYKAGPIDYGKTMGPGVMIKADAIPAQVKGLIGKDVQTRV